MKRRFFDTLRFLYLAIIISIFLKLGLLVMSILAIFMVDDSNEIINWWRDLLYQIYWITPLVGILGASIIYTKKSLRKKWVKDELDKEKPVEEKQK